MACSTILTATRAISTGRSETISSGTASRRLRGKKRSLEDLVADPEDEFDTDARASTSVLAASAPSVKRAKRAETRECPICGDHIPLRLLGQHFTLESTRVQTILDHVGDLDAFSDPHAPPHAPSIARRRAAAATQTSAIFASRLAKTLGAIKRRRKARNVALRAATRDEDDEPLAGKGKARADAPEQCPVCMRDVEGDPDVVAAHVDACLAHAELGLADDTDADADEDVSLDVEDDDVDLWEESEGLDGVRRLRLRGGSSRAAAAAAAALGFVVVSRTAEDVDDEIDVEGDDLGTFGAAQFTESDVLAEGSDGQHAGVVDLDLEIERARHGKDSQELISALESKVQRLANAASENSALGCRICLEAYSEPTVSTGCWHACCSACWLRCLKATGVCPICKRITVAGELRRIYL